MKPAKGSEFLLPIRGFFCLLCKEFYGDAICAEEHVTTHAHNEKYKKQMYENPFYEQRRNLDRQAGLALEPSGKKRKHEDEEKGSKDKEEKSKHKKDKKDREKKNEADDAVQNEEKSKVINEEEGDKLNPTKKGEDLKNVKSLGEEKPSYSKKDEEEKYKCSKKDDKYRNSREEEERGKYSRREEDDRYKYSRDEEYRYRYRRDSDDGYDNYPKYGPRGDENKYKYSKYSDFRSKYDKEQDERKSKAEKEAFKKPESAKPAGKPEVNKPEPPPKPYDPPKIFCGPSPAMRAKLRKQSLEASKPAPVATTTSFGKFTWKKKENVLAKEAEKVAAEFIKDDEAAVSQQQAVPVEDSFAKSMAVAKEIAQKLSGHHNMPPPWVSNGANRGRIRPNLPAPTAVLRKTAMMGKPAPLNTFLSIRPQNTSLLESPPKSLPVITDPPGPFQARPVPLVPKPFEANPLPPVFRPAAFEVKPSPVISKPAPVETKPVLSEANIPPSEATPEPSKAKPAPPAMVKIVSDVAAPGVPESEQTHTVFVKPPPFMNMGDGAQKSEKLKSNLAAAKAQDLFGIFYSSISQSGPSSITKPATDTRAFGRSADKSPLPAPQTPKPQPLPQSKTQSQPPAEVHKSLQHDSDSSPQGPQTQPKCNIQISSVWSLQHSPASTPEVAESETTSQMARQKLSLPAPSEAQSVPQNQSLTAKSESHMAPQSRLAELNATPQSKFIPEIQTEAQSEPKPNLDTQSHPETQPHTFPEPVPKPDQDTQPESSPKTQSDTAPESEPKPGPKTRGKTTPTKKPPPAPRPVRQTRYQTRRQQQQQQQQQSQSEPEPELASGDSDSATSDQKGLAMSDPGSGSQPEEGVLIEEHLQVAEVTPETLGLPSDMTSLDFEYDFNFE